MRAHKHTQIHTHTPNTEPDETLAKCVCLVYPTRDWEAETAGVSPNNSSGDKRPFIWPEQGAAFALHPDAHAHALAASPKQHLRCF